MYGFVTMAFVLALIEMGVNEWGIIHMSESGEVCEIWRQTHHLTFITSLVPGIVGKLFILLLRTQWPKKVKPSLGIQLTEHSNNFRIHIPVDQATCLLQGRNAQDHD